MLGLSQLSIKFKANSNMMSPVMQGVHVQCNCIWGRSDLPAFEGNGTMHWRELNCIALHSRELNCVQLISARWIAVREEVEILHGLMIIRDLKIVAFSVLTHTKLYWGLFVERCNGHFRFFSLRLAWTLGFSDNHHHHIITSWQMYVHDA